MSAIAVTVDYEAWRAPSPVVERVVATRPPMSKEIMARTAGDHRISVALLLSPDRRRFVVYARWDCMARLRAVQHAGKPRYSLPAIGRMLGGRDHTTILYGLRKWAALQAERAA